MPGSSTSSGPASTRAPTRRSLPPMPTESDLQSFLSAAAMSPTTTLSGSGGYCVYQSPSPYQSEYTANIFTPAAQNTAPPTCFGGGGIGGLFGGPPTPSYDQFTKWGEADADVLVAVLHPGPCRRR